MVLIGGLGTGKTHLATALSVSGVTRHSKKVRFYSTVDLVNQLEHEKLMNKPGRIAQSLARLDLVVLDELGYLTFSQLWVRFVSPADKAARAHQCADHHQHDVC